LDESLVMLGRTLGLGLLRYESRNVNADRPALDEVGEGVRELIAEHNRFDLRLYEAAGELFERRFVELGDAASAEAEQLREASIGPERPEAALVASLRRRSTGRASREPLVALLHVPKTGGPTLGHALRTALTKRGVTGSGTSSRTRNAPAFDWNGSAGGRTRRCGWSPA
jgi:hypothetical protein